jgi:predicted ribosomally synthesized peptide with nif11-like leader
MSSETFRMFLAKLENDEGLRKELRAAGGDANIPAEVLIAFAAGKGYAFGLEDVVDELDDRQLEAVAGGSTNSLNDQDMFALQRMMDQKSQLESMISNVMKASSNVQGSLAGALKAS